MATEDKVRGLGKKIRREMVRRWKSEGGGMSLKQWAAQAGVGDAANYWLQAKRTS